MAKVLTLFGTKIALDSAHQDSQLSLTSRSTPSLSLSPSQSPPDTPPPAQLPSEQVRITSEQLLSNNSTYHDDDKEDVNPITSQGTFTSSPTTPTTPTTASNTNDDNNNNNNNNNNTNNNAQVINLRSQLLETKVKQLATENEVLLAQLRASILQCDKLTRERELVYEQLDNTRKQLQQVQQEKDEWQTKAEQYENTLAKLKERKDNKKSQSALPSNNNNNIKLNYNNNNNILDYSYDTSYNNNNNNNNSITLPSPPRYEQSSKFSASAELPYDYNVNPFTIYEDGGRRTVRDVSSNLSVSVPNTPHHSLHFQSPLDLAGASHDASLNPSHPPSALSTTPQEKRNRPSVFARLGASSDVSPPHSSSSLPPSPPQQLPTPMETQSDFPSDLESRLDLPLGDLAKLSKIEKTIAVNRAKEHKKRPKCKFFPAGSCKQGDNCPFDHSLDHSSKRRK